LKKKGLRHTLFPSFFKKGIGVIYQKRRVREDLGSGGESNSL